MASSLISRSHHIDFDSVFRFDDAGIVQMFESLVSTGLMEFLGCPAIFHEQALIEFFENGSVRDGMVVSVIGGMAVEFSESVFAAAFGLPTEGLTDLSEVPKDLLSNAQRLFSTSEKEVSVSCLKKEVKMQYRLLSDILAKSLFVKAGSFDARTVSKKRPASVDADVAPVIKKKRTTKSKLVAAKKLVLEEPISAVPSTEEQIPVAGVATEEHIPVKEIATEDADATIRQFLTQLDLLQVESHCLLQLKVSCSGGTVASSRGDNLRWRVPVDWCTSLKVYQSQYTSRRAPVSSDILAKSLFVKAGSFDAVTRDRFLLMTAITFDVKVNWGSLLFGVLKEMVTPDSRQAKGFAIQICVLLKNIPGLELGDSKAFPSPRILNEKTVHHIVSVNENVGVEEVGDAPRAKTTPVKRTVSKKRPASVDADVAPVIKKKRTTKSKLVAAKKLVLEEPISAVPSTEEQIPVAGVATEEHIPVKEIATEDADATIRQFLTQLDLVFETHDDVQGGRDETWFDRAFDVAFVAGDQEDQTSDSLDHIFLELDPAGQTAGTMEVGDSSKQTVASKRSFKELMSVDDLLVQICDDMMLPSINDAEISKIRIGESIAMHDKGKVILVEDEPVQRNPVHEAVELICGDVEFLVDLRDQVMDDVVDFFHSFSLNKFTDLDALLALKAKEKLMLDWAETDSLETAVKRRLYILSRYREMLLRKLLDSHRQYLASGQPWTATASQIFDLLSAVHSKSLEALRILQQEHGIIFEQPCTSTAFDYAVDCGAVFAQFFSVAKSTCWVRLMIFVDGIWTPLQGPDFWRSGCKLSLVLNKVEMPAPAVQDIFVHSILFIEPVQYWGAAPFLPKTWAWHCVCTKVFPFSISGRLRPASCSTDLVVYSLDVQKLPAYLLDDFQRGVHTDCFAGYFGGSVVLSDSEIHSDSSSGCTVYRSPSPVENPFALGPAIFSRVDQAEQLYFVQLFCPIQRFIQTLPADSPASPPAAFSHQESSSSSSDVSIHFDSEELLMHNPEAAHTSAPVDSNVSTTALEDLRSYFSKRIDESTYELRSKVNEVEFNVRGDLVKQQAWLRQTFQNACDILERQSTHCSLRLGESGSSSRPPPVRVESRPLRIPPSPRDVAGSSGAVIIPTFPRTTGTFEERVEQARRHLLESGLVISVEEAAERIRQADIQESDRLQRERERARREKRNSSSRRRRGF
ncbi:hypothetical protein F511_34705 [Dorcoceras hygrometricum]|uniref:Dystroglycan-like n=1 Tax=Dorcoceras hygrometricum TaxID=472368 RepID=A0A2Z7DAZ4_9LAMI|nr:hypothetical protein F511_34705 [Dorcoceras hygrometricum]